MAKVKYRFFYKFNVKLASPVCVSSGSEEMTDHDVVLTSDGTPLIPGSSVAGAVREYVRRSFGNTVFLFGGESENVSMSRIIFSDMHIKDFRISVRDGIALDAENNNKVTLDTGKYDYQIIEAGAGSELRMEVTVFEKDNVTEDQVRSLIVSIVKAVNEGYIRFGYKKSRGLGRLKTEDSYLCRFFDFSLDNTYRIKNAEAYIEFCKDIYGNEKYDHKSLSNYNEISLPDDTMLIRVPLKLEGGISIRSYSARPGDPDFTQLTSGIGENKRAVIPGSTWNGALRTRVLDIFMNELPDLNREKMKKELFEFWGVINEKEHVYQLSSVSFDESVLMRSTAVQMTRNSVNRFDSSSKEGALYTEISYFGGDTILEIMVRNSERFLWCIELIMMAVEDLRNGLLSVGGQTAVGRGIFSGNGDIVFCNKHEYNGTILKRIKGDDEI